MNNKAIGVFDSGMGGLTAVAKMTRIMPNESICYFGDTSRVPYGTRSQATIIKYTRQDINLLLSLDVKAILVACGTSSAVALEHVRSQVPVPIIGVLESAVCAALKSTKNHRVGIIGTNATIKSGAYEKLLLAQNPEVQIKSVSCPLFVPLVENGRVGKDDPVVAQIVAEYLAPIKESGADTLILGCTHYPLLSAAIGAFMGEGVSLIDPGHMACLTMKELLEAQGLQAGPEQVGALEFMSSDCADSFAQLASLYMGGQTVENVRQIDVESY